MLKTLWDWLVGWVWGRVIDDPLDVYKPAERRIYQYWDGTRMVKEDPMVLWKRVMDKGPEISIDMKVARSISSGAREAHDKLLKNVREVFSLKPFGEGGLSEWDALDLLDHFLTYCGMVKKNSNPSATSSSSSVDSPTSSGEGPPTPPSSDSGSTGSECTSDVPPPSPSV